jgi:hypothetical protein
LLVDLLIRSGDLREAHALLAAAPAVVESESGLMESQIWLHLMQRDFAAAAQWLERLRAKGVTGDTLVTLGRLHETARRDDDAAILYAAALETGYYPEAEVGLARLALHRDDKLQARQRALAALNLERSIAKKAAGVRAIFDGVLHVLLQLEPVVAEASAWVCVLNPHKDFGPLTSHVVLTFARSEAAAREYVAAVLNAFRPSQPPVVGGEIQVQLAPKDRQPVGAVVCGIHSYWK